MDAQSDFLSPNYPLLGEIISSLFLNASRVDDELKKARTHESYLRNRRESSDARTDESRALACILSLSYNNELTVDETRKKA